MKIPLFSLALIALTATLALLLYKCWNKPSTERSIGKDQQHINTVPKYSSSVLMDRAIALNYFTSILQPIFVEYAASHRLRFLYNKQILHIPEFDLHLTLDYSYPCTSAHAPKLSFKQGIILLRNGSNIPINFHFLDDSLHHIRIFEHPLRSISNSDKHCHSIRRLSLAYPFSTQKIDNTLPKNLNTFNNCIKHLIQSNSLMTDKKKIIAELS